MSYLQNHIGDLTYPGEKYFHPDWAQARLDPRTKLLTSWILIGAMMGIAVLLLCAINYGGTPARGRAGLLTFMGVAAVVVAVLGTWGWRRYQATRSSLWRAQVDYNTVVGRTAPTPEQLEALQIGSVWDYRDKAWGHSLAKFPCEREVAHVPQWQRRFAMLDPGSLTDHRAALMEWWGIGTATSYRQMVQRLFGGLHWRDLDEAYLQAADVPALIDHLAGRSDLPAAYIDECIHGSLQQRGVRPPARLWGWDLGRISIIARGAYGAGLIDADEAWRDIALASEWVRTIFPTCEDFFRNVHLGYAYWSEDYTQIHAFGVAVRDALTNREGWPVLAQEWRPASVALAAYVWHGWDDLDSGDDQQA